MEKMDNLLSNSQSTIRSEDVARITRVIRPIIEHCVKEVFISSQLIFLTRPIDYVVPAVWGFQKEGELDDEQREINNMIEPCVKNIFKILALNNLNCDQVFAVNFLIRELLAAKIRYTTEMVKNMLMNVLNSDKQNFSTVHQANILDHLEVSGTA